MDRTKPRHYRAKNQPPPQQKRKGRGGDEPHPHQLPHTPTPQPTTPRRKRGRRETEAGHTRDHAPQHPNQEKTGEQTKPKPTHTHTTPPGMPGYKRATRTNRRTPQRRNKEWRGTAETRAQAHTPTPHNPARSCGVHAERARKHTYAQIPQPGVSGRGSTPSPSTQPRTAPPAKGGRGPGETHKPIRTHPNTPTRSGGAQPKPEPKHTQPNGTPEPGTAGYKQSAHTTTHAPRPQPRMVGCKPKRKPNRIHHKPQPGLEGRNHKPYPNTTQDPSQGWQAYRNPSPSTTQTQTQTPHNSRKPSVHSLGTEAARVMQVTRPNEIWSPGVRLYPKACAALGIEAERATPKRLGTPVPRICMHALGTGYLRKSGEPLGFRPKEGTCASTGAHPPGEISTSRWQRSALPVLPRAALLGATSKV